MRKILHLRSSSSVLGAERVILELCENLPTHGFDPIIGIPIVPTGTDSPLRDAAHAAGITVQDFPASGPFDLRVLRDVQNYVRKNRIQIVHSHGYREDLYALACRKHAALIATNHLWKRTTWRLQIYAKLDSYLLRRFPKIVAVSDEIAEEMCFSGIRKDRIDVIANGVNTDVLSQRDPDLRKEFGFDRGNVILGTVSSLTSEKAIHHAISAFAVCSSANPALRFLIVGEGPELTSLRDLINDLGIENKIVLAGRRHDVPRIYATIDIFLLPSLIEGLPMALLEAMATGLPVIATAVGDVPKVVDSDVGALIPPADEFALVESIDRFSSNRNTRITLGRNAKRRIADHYSSRAMTAKYACLYEQLTTAGQG